MDNLLELAALTQRNLGNTGLLTYTPPDNSGFPGNTPVPYQVRKPWLDEPDGSSPVIKKNAGNLGIVGTTLTLTLFTCPEGSDACIKWISNNITGGGFQDGSGDLIWSFQIDGRPIDGLEALNTQNGTPATPIPVSPIRVLGGQTVTGTCNHVANGALAGNVIMAVEGYKYPRQATQ